MTTPPDIKAKRPLSPHLQVYKPQMTSMTSILNRVTGAGLAVGLVFFTWWLVAASVGPQAYDTFMNFAGSPLGLLLMFGWVAAFYYHLFNGIRHLFWDFAVGLNLKSAYKTGAIVLILTALASVVTFIGFLSIGGIF